MSDEPQAFVTADGRWHAVITGAATYRGVRCDVLVSECRDGWAVGAHVQHCDRGWMQRETYEVDGETRVRERHVGAGASGMVPRGASLAVFSRCVERLLEQCLITTAWEDAGARFKRALSRK